MLAELLEQDHGQKVGPGKTARGRMEWRWRLRDGLASPAGEFLAHRLDDLPTAWNNLQRLGDVFAQLRQLRRTARRTTCRRRDHDALARQMLRKRFARRALALRRRRAARLGRGFLGQKLIFRRSCLKLFELQLHLLQEPRFALRANAVKRPAQLFDLEPQMSDRRLRAGARRLGPSLREKAGGALGEDHRVSGGKIGRKSVKGRGHKARES
jgi:hypothetical protein